MFGISNVLADGRDKAHAQTREAMPRAARTPSVRLLSLRHEDPIFERAASRSEPGRITSGEKASESAGVGLGRERGERGLRAVRRVA